MKNQPKRTNKKLVCPKAGTTTSFPAVKTLHLLIEFLHVYGITKRIFIRDSGVFQPVIRIYLDERSPSDRGLYHMYFDFFSKK